MAAIANGLAAYRSNTIIPVTSSFSTFYLYAAPAVRMGALQKLHVIHLATHNSIGMREDGPTCQPIEIAALYRTMPNILYIRPADREETAGAWIAGHRGEGHAFIYIHLKSCTSAAGVDVSQLKIAVQTAKAVRAVGHKVRAVSFPCQRLFDKQSQEHKHAVLAKRAGRSIVVIKAYAATGWERYASVPVCMTTDRYGQSLPGSVAYRYFGFEPDQVIKKLCECLRQVKEEPELLQGSVGITKVDGKVDFLRA